jgi:hypothetical protein
VKAATRSAGKAAPAKKTPAAPKPAARAKTPAKKPGAAAAATVDRDKYRQSGAPWWKAFL